MNLQFYLEKLNSLENFQNFKKENPEAYLCSGFFIIDKESGANKQHLDFFIPEKRKIFSFQLEENGKMIPLENISEEAPKEIQIHSNITIEEIEKIVSEKMEEKEIKNKIQKLIFSLQTIEGEEFLVGTVFISMLGMIKMNINLKEKKVTDFKKKSFFDMMKILKKK